MRGVISPTSSRKTVPRLASSKAPERSRKAPVKLPRTCPNSSVSRSVSVYAAQLTVTSGAPLRRLVACINFATISFPAPLSPVIRTFASHRAACEMSTRILSMAGLTPTIIADSIVVPPSPAGRGVPRLRLTDEARAWNSTLYSLVWSIAEFCASKTTLMCRNSTRCLLSGGKKSPKVEPKFEPPPFMLFLLRGARSLSFGDSCRHSFIMNNWCVESISCS